MSKLTPEEERSRNYEATRSPKQKVIDLWNKRPPEKRKDGMDVLAFYGELQSHEPSLFSGIGNDPYQTVQAWLSQHLNKP